MINFPISYRVFRVFQRNFIVFKKNWPANLMFNFLEPLFYLWALGYGLGIYVNDIEGLPYINWIAPGLIATSAMWASSFECTYDSYMRMSYQKIYHAIIATPINLQEVVVGEMLFGTFKSVLYGTVFLLVLFVLGFIPSIWALLVPFVLILIGVSIAEMAICWTSLVPNIDSFNFFFTLIITPMFILSGVFFPIEGIPEPIQTISWFLPLYHGVELIRSLILGWIDWSLLYHTLWLIIFIAVLFKIPIYLMHRRLIDK